MWKEYYLFEYEERVCALSRCDFERVLEVVGTLHPQGVKLNTELRACTFHLSDKASGPWIGRIPEDGHPREAGEGFLEYPQPFPTKLGRNGGQPRSVPARPGKARHEMTNRVTHPSKDDGDCLGRVLRGLSGRRIYRKDNVNFKTDQFSGKGGESFGCRVSESVFDENVLPLNVAELAESLSKCV